MLIMAPKRCTLSSLGGALRRLAFFVAVSLFWSAAAVQEEQTQDVPDTVSDAEGDAIPSNNLRPGKNEILYSRIETWNSMGKDSTRSVTTETNDKVQEKGNLEVGGQRTPVSNVIPKKRCLSPCDAEKNVVSKETKDGFAGVPSKASSSWFWEGWQQKNEEAEKIEAVLERSDIQVPTFLSRSSSTNGTADLNYAWMLVVWIGAFVALGTFVGRFSNYKRLHHSYQELPMTESRHNSPSQEEFGVRPVSLGTRSRTVPQVFFIGDSEAPSSGTSSPRPLSLSRCSSEPEPEGELFPSSTENSPRISSQPIYFPLTPTVSGPVAAASSAVNPFGLGSTSVSTESAPQASVVGRSGPGYNSSTAAGGRLAMLYASPLCYRDNSCGLVPITQLPIEKEWENISLAYDESAVALRDAHRALNGPAIPYPSVVLSAQPLTARALLRSVAPVSASGAASVLHLSAHGIEDCLVLEDDRGSAHFLNCDMLRNMLELREDATTSNGGVRLVVLNACRLRAIGEQFACCSIPHVIGTSVQLRDSTSRVFLRTFYGNLFQGSSVLRAYSAALVALRSDPDDLIRAAADHFYLLPEDSDHNEVLFVPVAPKVSKAAAVPVAAAAFAIPRPFRVKPCLGKQPTPSTTAAGSTEDSAGSRQDDCSSSDMDSVTGTLSGAGSFTDLGSDDDLETRCLLQLEHVSQAQSRSIANRRPPRKGPETYSASASKAGASRSFTGSPGEVARRAMTHSPFSRALPPAPDDFLGRALDVWAILQHLGTRRAVVVCGEHHEDNQHAPCIVQQGIGKSAVMDAVNRAFTLHMGGLCIGVQMRALSEADTIVSKGGWVQKLQAAIRSALHECQESWWPTSGTRIPPTTLVSRCGSQGPFGSVLRRRNRRQGSSCDRVSHGFHPLSDPIALRPAIEELIADMTLLSDLCEMRKREWPAASGEVLLLLDECDHLIQQHQFQDAIAGVLQRCSGYRVVLSTHQPMVGTAGGQFKVVHQAIGGLEPDDAARLFLRRSQRALRWEEIRPLRDEFGLRYGSFNGDDSGNQALNMDVTFQAAMAKVGAQDFRSKVVLVGANEAEVLQLVSNHPAVAAQSGNPRQLIELASKVVPTLRNLSDLG